MKYLKLVVTLSLLGVLATSFGLAADGQKAVTKNLIVKDLINEESTDLVAKGGRIRATMSEVPEPVAETLPMSMPPLSGTYTVGGAGTYTTLGDAVLALNTNGVSGPVVMELLDASYLQNPVTLGTIAGASAVNTVTFRPAAGVAATVRFIAYSGNGKGFSLVSSSYVTIDGVGTGGASLTFEWNESLSTFPSLDSRGATVYMSASSEIALRNMTIRGIVDPLGETDWDLVEDARAAVYARSVTGPNVNVTVDNCVLGRASYGVLASSGQSTITVMHSDIGGAFDDPVLIGGIAANGGKVDLHHNNIIGMQFNTLCYFTYTGVTEFFPGSGIYAAILCQIMATGSTIHDNVMDDIQAIDNIGGLGTSLYGMRSRASSDNGITVYNNCVTRVGGTDPFALYVGWRPQNTNGYHNSVHLSGDMTDGNDANASWTFFPLGGGTTRNNIFSNTMTGDGPDDIEVLEFVAAGVMNNNAYYAAGGANLFTTGASLFAHNAATGHDGASAVGDPYFLSDSDLHIDTTQLSSASNIGAALGAGPDVDLDTRDPAFPDAGYDEYTLETDFDHEVSPQAFTAPDVNGQPNGVASPIKVIVRNNRNVAKATFNVHLEVDSAGTTVYSEDLASGALTAMEAKELTFPAWTPYMNDPYTITVITEQPLDQFTDNDTLVRSQAVVPIIPVSGSYATCFNTGLDQFGWLGTGDFELSSSFTKLNGPYDGTSWVTVAGAPGSGMSDASLHLVLSPIFDLSSLSDVYVSFYHSIMTEAKWDRSWFQYTTDDGVTWVNAGVLNDPNGINWYSESVYANALSDGSGGSCIDEATYVNLGSPGGALPIAGWSSNGDCLSDPPTQDPNGWIFVQLKMTALAGNSNVRFRYIVFTDAGTHGDGHAIDCFTVADAAPAFTGTIEGHKYHDFDGNGIDDDGLPVAGKGIIIKYFGVPVDTVFTNISGDYSYSVAAPGDYNVSEDNPSGLTEPLAGEYNISHPADGSNNTGNDFGNYVGSISGKKFSDLNDNGIDDAEPGLAGWTIEVHRDSATGPIVYKGSKVTGALGAYSVNVGPGTYVVKEVAQSGVGRQTHPVGGTHTVVISGNSNTDNETGVNFGNFLYGTLRVELTFDINGNGVRDIADATGLPAPHASNFSVKKNGVHLTGSPFTLGNGVGGKNFSGLDTGTYVVHEETFTPGWIRTLGGDQSFVMNVSGEKDTAAYLDFAYLTISGKKFNDMDGDGVKDLGEPGLAGWKINVTGGTYHGSTSATTDGSGLYSIDSVGPGTHTISEVLQAGWVRTLPGGAGTYVFSAVSGHLSNPTADRDFGNFAEANVDGIVYRDYNGNGTMDPGDTPMSGVTVNLASGPTDVSDGSGYEFIGLITDDTVTIVLPVGFTISAPVGGEHFVALSSGGGAKGLHFGLFQTSDSSAKYRTFTALQLSAAAEKKPGKRPKAGKAYDPIKNKPNSANMIFDLIDPKTGQGYILKVGVAGQLNAGGKTKAYWQPKKQGDVWKSLDNKGIKHAGAARGFDQDLKGKPILKQQKSLSPGKKIDNTLFSHLLALQVNLTASGAKTPAGLGILIYNDAGNSLHGMTIDEIAAYADTIMTNFEFVPLGEYQNLDSIAQKINAAFFFPATDDTANGWAALKLTWKAYTSVSAIPFLLPNPGATPVNRKLDVVAEVPDAFTLAQNYPNPFNPTTTIEFDLPDVSIVTLKVYNLLGQEVATLLDREILDYGEEVEFDASTLPSGVYLYRIVAETIVEEGDDAASESFTQVKKMVLVK